MPEEAFVPVVSVTGEVVPARSATVSARTSGPAIEVLVTPGDEVAAGDVLVRLDPTDAELALRRAEVQLEAARARLALLQSRPRPEEVAVAEAQVKVAQAQVSQAVARRDQLKAGAPEAEIASAQARATRAQAEHLEAYEIHEDTMECFKFTLPDGETMEVCPLLGPTETKARFRMQAAAETLEAARARAEALVEAKDARIAAVEAAVWAAAEQRDVAEAQLASLQAGPTPEELADAEAAVQQAEAVVAEARVALERTEVRAPFAGTVGLVAVREDERVEPAQPLVTLGDLSTLRVETTDLDEIDVARVEVGQQATVTFDALPDEAFAGRVVRIAPMAESDGGGVNYTAVITLDALDPAIRWGMTAFVDIEVPE
jgi:multidrug resistance efflux pump